MPPTSPGSREELAPHLAILRSGRWFAQLAPELSGALLGMSRIRTLAAGEALFLRGDAPCGLYAVLRGAIRISGTGGPRDGEREALLTMLEAPTWFGEIAVFDGSARTHDAHADDAATLLHVPQDALLAWLGEHPQHWRELALLLTGKLRIAFVAMEELALLPAAQRLARRLVLMAEGYGEWQASDRSRRVIEISQEQLSMMLAISRQTTNQILKDLEARKVLRVHRGEVEILDLQALRDARR